MTRRTGNNYSGPRWPSVHVMAVRDPRRLDLRAEPEFCALCGEEMEDQACCNPWCDDWRFAKAFDGIVQGDT